MKRITVAYPFEDVRGKLAGNQELEYAENNNPAFEAPAGRQYARNYKTCMIACKRSATGKTYFQIKTKTATKVNAGSKLRMALLGGTGACRAAILSNGTLRTQVEAIYAAAKTEGRTSAKTVEKYVYDVVYEGLQSKSVMFTFLSANGGTLNVHNPWVYTNQQAGTGITIKNTILVKFWNELAANPIMFTVEGLKGVAHDGDSWSDLTQRGYNVLSATISGDGVAINSMLIAEVSGGTTTPVDNGDKISAQSYVLVEP